jgi:hypothetical protein
MAKIPTKPKTIRKLVTLPPELAERVEKYRLSSAAASESDALKALIEDGLKLKDSPLDLIKRFESATKNGQHIGEIVNGLAIDHPLVQSTYLDSNEALITLKTPSDAPSQRFRFSRSQRTWRWDRAVGYGHDDNWEEIPIDPPAPSPKPAAGYGSAGKASDLDDDIPF